MITFSIQVGEMKILQMPWGIMKNKKDLQC